MASKPLRCDDR